MEKRSWKRTFFTIQSGQAISLITSSALQMALIFYLTEKTNEAPISLEWAAEMVRLCELGFEK